MQLPVPRPGKSPAGGDQVSSFGPYRRFQILHPERLAQESPVDLLRYEIAGDQDNLQILPPPGRDIGQFNPRHVGHADIGDHHPQIGRMRQQRQRLGASAGLNDPVTEVLQELGNDNPYLWIVIHNHQSWAIGPRVRRRANVMFRHAGQRHPRDIEGARFSLGSLAAAPAPRPAGLINIGEGVTAHFHHGSTNVTNHHKPATGGISCKSVSETRRRLRSTRCNLDESQAMRTKLQ